MADIFVAKIGKTVGLKGELKLHIDTDFPDQFKKGRIFTTNKKQKLTIERFNPTSKVVKFVEINSIDEAKKYINSELLSSKEDTVQNCKLEEGQFFWFDLIGLKVVENDELLGVVDDIHRYPTDDYFQIKTDQSLKLDIEKLPKTFLLPYNDIYIQNVDIANKIITTTGAKEIIEAS